MHDALGVGRVQRVRHVDGDSQQLLDFQRAVADQMLQGLAFQVLHDNERGPIIFADVIDGANVGMIQCRSGLGLAAKAAQRLLVAGNVLGEKLEGDEAAEARVLGLINYAHPATAKFLNHAVVGDSLSNHDYAVEM